jgi:hypothetical protein
MAGEIQKLMRYIRVYSKTLAKLTLEDVLASLKRKLTAIAVCLGNGNLN